MTDRLTDKQGHRKIGDNCIIQRKIFVAPSSAILDFFQVIFFARNFKYFEIE
jgi:hypothetical protein